MFLKKNLFSSSHLKFDTSNVGPHYETCEIYWMYWGIFLIHMFLMEWLWWWLHVDLKPWNRDWDLQRPHRGVCVLPAKQFDYPHTYYMWRKVYIFRNFIHNFCGIHHIGLYIHIRSWLLSQINDLEVRARPIHPSAWSIFVWTLKSTLKGQRVTSQLVRTLSASKLFLPPHLVCGFLMYHEF